MRSEKEMMELIISVAASNERIRAVYMNGSRANPNAVKDKYQDYDIVYVVTETKWFLENKDWISVFGNPLIIQEPDFIDNLTKRFSNEQYDFSRRYAWLMLFDDGNRIDLGIEIKEETEKGFLSDKLTVILLDKDNFLPQIPPPTDEDYHIKKPTEGIYIACCNEFWWCLNNLAKGIERDQLTYALNMYIQVVHRELERMVEWHIGIYNSFSVSVGMWGKYFKKYLPHNLYDMYIKTYPDANYENLWNAVFASCELFRILALDVGNQLGYAYNMQDDENMADYLAKIKMG